MIVQFLNEKEKSYFYISKANFFSSFTRHISYCSLHDRMFLNIFEPKYLLVSIFVECAIFHLTPFFLS